jgi:signal transduction histidine kinase
MVNEFYTILTSTIACSTYEQAIETLRQSNLFQRYNAQCSENLLSESTIVQNSQSEIHIQSKHFHLQYTENFPDYNGEVAHFFKQVLTVLDDKKDACSETLHGKRSIQELDIFTIFAHEFRTPLTVIHSSVELLLEYFTTWDHEKNIEFLTMVQTQTNSIASLLEKIAELYDARTNSQEVVTVSESNLQEFFHQIESILSKRFIFSIENISSFPIGSFTKIPIRAFLYVLSVVLQFFKSDSIPSKIVISTNKIPKCLTIEISTSSRVFSDEELKLLNTLFENKIIEDVSGEWLQFLLAAICTQYLNASVMVSNSKMNEATIDIHLFLLN